LILPRQSPYSMTTPTINPSTFRNSCNFFIRSSLIADGFQVSEDSGQKTEGR
jgi:hypothetical protein